MRGAQHAEEPQRFERRVTNAAAADGVDVIGRDPMSLEIRRKFMRAQLHAGMLAAGAQ